VLNTDGDPEGLIRHGNERVLRAFQRCPLFLADGPKTYVAGSRGDASRASHSKRIWAATTKRHARAALASWISETIKQSGQEIRPGVVHKAVLLAKADLTTELVKEFTELQGIVGGLYLRAQRSTRICPRTRFAIADAIYDQYKPNPWRIECRAPWKGGAFARG